MIGSMVPTIQKDWKYCLLKDHLLMLIRHDALNILLLSIVYNFIR